MIEAKAAMERTQSPAPWPADANKRRQRITKNRNASCPCALKGSLFQLIDLRKSNATIPHSESTMFAGILPASGCCFSSAEVNNPLSSHDLS